MDPDLRSEFRNPGGDTLCVVVDLGDLPTTGQPEKNSICQFISAGVIG